MNILQPKIIISVAILSVFLILISLAQEMNNRWQVQRQVQKLEQEVNEMTKTVIEADNLNKYFSTDDYLERVAREKLNYKAEGEKVILISDESFINDEKEKYEGYEKSDEPIPMRWWNLFFVEDKV